MPIWNHCWIKSCINSLNGLCALQMFAQLNLWHIENSNIFTYLQKPLGCKGPLEIIWSNSPDQEGSDKANSPGACPLRFWIPPRLVIPQSICLFHCLTNLTVKTIFLVMRWNFLCYSPLLSVGSTEKSLIPPSSFPNIRCLHTLRSLLSLLQTEKSHLFNLFKCFVSWSFSTNGKFCSRTFLSPQKPGIPKSQC